MSGTATTLLKVFVKPNAQKFRYQWLDKTILKVDIPAPPENNKANEMLIKLLSQQLNIPTSHIQLKGGATSKHKFILIHLELQEIIKRLP